MSIIAKPPIYDIRIIPSPILDFSNLDSCCATFSFSLESALDVHEQKLSNFYAVHKDHFKKYYGFRGENLTVLVACPLGPIIE